MALNVVISISLLLLFTSVELGHANPGLEGLEDLDDYHNFTKRDECPWTNSTLTYSVWIRTCDRLCAGTDGEVKIGFVGPDPNCKAPANYALLGPASLYNLDTPNYDDFEQNDMNSFNVTAPRLSQYNELAGFRIYHSDNSDRWCFNYIIIHSKYQDANGNWKTHNYRKNYNNWIWRGFRDLDLVEQF